jgi:enoyl-CoA hydratase/carnithine racemase
MALSASAGFRRGGVERALGYSLRVAAEAQTRLGTTAETREYIAESVELLERYGHRTSLAKALELSGKFTGNRSHARRAKELLAEG